LTFSFLIFILDPEKLFIMDGENSIIETVAHDLRGVINKINLINTMLSDTIPKNQESSQLLSYIHLLCEQGTKITEDLISYCENDSKKIHPCKLSSISMLVNQQSEIYSLEARKKKIGFEIFVPKEQFYSLIDEDKFIRVLDNLFSNALKFTAPGGQINIFVSSEKERINVSVSDNGIGIPPRLKTEIFKKYSIARRYGTQKEMFTGLGLYISKNIIEMYNGNLSFQSMENKGSVFIIELKKEKSLTLATDRA
jgi:two-component system, OmpR family, sensor histidine kinase VicK